MAAPHGRAGLYNSLSRGAHCVEIARPFSRKALVLGATLFECEDR
jgi:hypothetical protein